VATATTRGAFRGAVSGFSPSGVLATGAVGTIAPHMQKATNATLARAGLDVQRQVDKLAADGRVLQTTTAKLVTETPKSVLTGGLSASLAALFSGNPEDMVSAAVDGAVAKTEGAASGTATDLVKETLQRRIRRP
jgi:hypothetical protein